MQFRNREISDNQSYNRKNKFHQYDLTIHLHFGSVVQVLTNVAVLLSLHSPAALYVLQYQVSILEKRLPNSFNIEEACPSRTSSRSKTLPEGPIMFRVACGNPESRQRMVLGLGKVEVYWECGSLS